MNEIDPNRLVLHIQPEEGIELQVKAKRPGPTVRVETVKLDFSYKDFGDTTAATGYERLLYDCMVGRQHAVPPGRHGRGGLADRDADPGRVAGPAGAATSPTTPPGRGGRRRPISCVQQDGRRWYASP